jgi:hypothetical protein
MKYAYRRPKCQHCCPKMTANALSRYPDVTRGGLQTSVIWITPRHNSSLAHDGHTIYIIRWRPKSSSWRRIQLRFARRRAISKASQTVTPISGRVKLSSRRTVPFLPPPPQASRMRLPKSFLRGRNSQNLVTSRGFRKGSAKLEASEFGRRTCPMRSLSSIVLSAGIPLRCLSRQQR